MKSLKLQRGDNLLTRGGTTSIGLAAASIARNHGATVIATTRRNNKDVVDLLTDCGVSKVVIDTGNIAEDISQIWPGGGDKVLELIGTVTLDDSIRCAGQGGIICMAGIVDNKWTLNNWNPMESIPQGISLTIYNGGPQEFMETPLSNIARQVKEG